MLSQQVCNIKIPHRSMTQILILADNTFSDVDDMVMRGTGAHKIATHLRSHGWRVEVVDFILRWELGEFQELCQSLVGPDTLMLGVSSNLFTDRDSFNSKLRWFKETYPHISIVLGGNNLLGREMEPVDYMVEGYAESAMLALLDFLSGKIARNQVKWSKFTDAVALIDATVDYPHNDTHDLTIRYQPSDFIMPHETLAIETARGCIFKCKFCTYPLIGKKKTDFLRHPANLRDELLRNYETHGVTNYIIAEDTFNDSVEKLENLAEAISQLSFRPQFASFIRFDLVCSKPQTLDLLRAIGLRAAHFGIETFNNEDGKLIRKGMDAEKIKEGLLWWAQEAADIATHVGMIFGLPNCDEETARRDNEWLATSGINWWSWSALWITDTTKTIHTSEFSHDYKKYGYELMSDSEIDFALEQQRIKQGAMDNFFHYNTKSFRQKMTYWKHQQNGQNFFTAADLCNELNANSRTRRLGGFHVFTRAGLGYDINEVMKWGYFDVDPPVPQADMKMRTNQLIQDYIQKKLDFEYTYNILPQMPTRKIIPITAQA